MYPRVISCKNRRKFSTWPHSLALRAVRRFVKLDIWMALFTLNKALQKLISRSLFWVLMLFCVTPIVAQKVNFN